MSKRENIEIARPKEMRVLADDAPGNPDSRFQPIMEHLGALLFIADRGGLLSYVSPSAFNLLGFLPGEMSGLPFVSFLDELDAGPFSSAFSETLSFRVPDRVVESRIRRKNGTHVWGEIHLQYFVERGEPCIIGLIHDIALRKRAESLSAFRLHLQSLGDSEPIERVLKAALDEISRITRSSFGFSQRINHDQTAFFIQACSASGDGDSCSEAASDASFSRRLAEFWIVALRERKTVIDNGSDGASDLRFRENNREECRRSVVVPLLEGGEVIGIFGVTGKEEPYDAEDSALAESMADIAWEVVASKMALHSEQLAQEMLIQSQKMALIGQLAGGIATDFDKMLGLIIENTQRAIHQKGVSHAVAGNLKEILRASMRSADLIRQLLSFAKRQTVMPMVIEINLMVERMLPMLRRLIGSQIELEWVPAEERIFVKMDPTQVDQLLANLCINARDAITGKGKIIIKTAKTDVDDGYPLLRSPFLTPGEYALLSVTDNGCGINKHVLPHIFEPFFTTKELGKGIGLGLSTVYGIVKQHKGGIDCKSEPGRGSTFSAYLPWHEGENYLL
ncbi:MAG: ATP-binding protein [Chlorobiaceae bacterium]